MALWGSPILEGRVGFHAGYQCDWPLRVCHDRCHADGSASTHGHPAVSQASNTDPTIVPPAYYIELRALAIREEEIEASGSHCDRNESTQRAPLRPWPFRWPDSEASDAAASAEVPPQDQPKGRFLDIYA